ncbi:MAG: metal-binding protein, partial [Oscillochloris sp.]|nr:metal-binding protein [Oscillochloris sp.]
IIVPNYHLQIVEAITWARTKHPDAVLAFLIGFCTGSAAHSIADWLVTHGKHILRSVGIHITRDYHSHDRYVPRRRKSRR